MADRIHLHTAERLAWLSNPGTGSIEYRQRQRPGSLERNRTECEPVQSHTQRMVQRSGVLVGAVRHLRQCGTKCDPISEAQRLGLFVDQTIQNCGALELAVAGRCVQLPESSELGQSG